MSAEELLGDSGIEWSHASIRKAEVLIEEGKVHRDPEHPDVFRVEGSKDYRVQTDGKNWLSCSCPNGQRTSRPSCYHSAAALMIIRDEQDHEDELRGETQATLRSEKAFEAAEENDGVITVPQGWFDDE